MSRAAPYLVAVVGALLVHLVIFEASYTTFSASVDFNAGALEDFMGPYLQQGHALADGRNEPVEQFLYPPFFAWLMRPFAGLDPGTASWLWLALQLAAAALVVALPLRLVPGGGRQEDAAFLFIGLTAFPLAHNFHWGQVSTLLWAMSLLSLQAWQRSRSTRAGAWLGVAGAIKVFPLGLAGAYLLGRDRRAWVVAVGLAVVLGFGLPAALMGVGPTLDFYAVVQARVRSHLSGAWEGASNRQDLAQVIARWTGAAWGLPIALGLALGAAASAARSARRRAALSDARTFALVAGGLLLVLPPGWPHYFVTLPFLQLVAWRDRGDLLDGGLVVASVAAASVVTFELAGGAAAYASGGWIAASNLAVLVALARAAWRPQSITDSA